ncbi:hypothetical protein ACFO4N_08050 [Camelliibacillus cellulosilyticus]|uniref:Uncharacterized protein n=1 Tax=Camelliibacillus cellulosilyticus TaxID=2174486 RepID=A0ABV9GL70_9BACL
MNKQTESEIKDFIGTPLPILSLCLISLVVMAIITAERSGRNDRRWVKNNHEKQRGVINEDSRSGPD